MNIMMPPTITKIDTKKITQKEIDFLIGIERVRLNEHDSMIDESIEWINNEADRLNREIDKINTFLQSGMMELDDPRIVKIQLAQKYLANKIRFETRQKEALENRCIFLEMCVEKIKNQLLTRKLRQKYAKPAKKASKSGTKSKRKNK